MIGPYYEDDSVTLYCGDFRDLLPDVLAQHGEPDLTLTDPPYGETSESWDYWPDQWPALIPTRSMWCFGSMRLFMERRDEFAGWKFSHDVVWQKNTGSGFIADRFRRVHDHATFWYRGAWSEVHHKAVRVQLTGPRQGRTPRRNVTTPHTTGGRITESKDWVETGTRLATSVLFAPSMRGKAINRTEKPGDIVAPLIEYGCPPGGLVLDVFAGSCSTLVAARNSGRRAVGIELREEQCAKAVESRLSQSVLPFGEAS